jgi:general secretion pathway protein K
MTGVTRLARRPSGSRTQMGAAILTAMLTVVLVASLASATLWQQWRGVEVEAAERSRISSSWVLVGALDWARLILREDARKGGADHLAEPWAVPLEPARLSTFLAADRSDALAADESQEAFLAGQITDLQSRLNVNNLVQGGKRHEPSYQAFLRLFTHLGLAPLELDLMVDRLTQMQPSPAAGTTGESSAGAALMPQDVNQLGWLGLSAVTVEVLRPFVTVLPQATPVNLNTAPLEVVYACLPTLQLADARRLVSARATKHLASLADVSPASGQPLVETDSNLHSVASRYFEVRGQLRIDQTTVQEVSVVQREGMNVSVLWRQRGVAALTRPPTMNRILP